jgi:uncharacterized protein with HEPN domain
MADITGVRRKSGDSAVTLDAGDRHNRASHKRAKPKVDETQALLQQLQGWWDEAREFHAENRRQQLLDFDFYDHHQIDPDHARVMLDRGQMPTVYNLIALALDWIIGTERRTRIEGKVHPRGPEDQQTAQAKQQVLKYVDDVNYVGFEQSRAFAQAAKGGIGWMEECIVKDPGTEPLARRSVDWKQMWWDAFATRLDLQDARYITRRKWLDIDYAQAMFHEHADRLDGMAKSFTEIELSDSDDLADMPAMFLHRDVRTALDSGYRLFGSGSIDRQWRRRIPINETWYKKPVAIKRMVSLDPDLNEAEFDPANARHAELLDQGLVSLTDAIKEQVCDAFWVPGLLLAHQVSPYKHNRYPFTPLFCKREDRTNLPYGYIRGMRDAQTDYNKRRSKTLWMLSVNRLIYEAGAIDKDDEDEILDEASRPDARIRVAKGALADNRIKFEWGGELAQGQITLMEHAKDHILENSGITKENLGQNSNAISGRAILAKQQQGAVSTAELFDNYRFTMQVGGQKALALIEQYMSLPKRLRILGPAGKVDWLIINEPQVDPETGETFFANDLTAAAADYIVDQQDYRETVRMAMAEQLFEVIAKLPPEMQINLLDIAIELTDLPNRAELVARIRALNGQRGPGEEPNPADIEAQATRQRAEQAAADLDAQARSAKIQKDLAAANKQNAEAKRIAVEGKVAALDGAALLNAAVPLAPAADRLYEGEQPQEQA